MQDLDSVDKAGRRKVRAGSPVHTHDPSIIARKSPFDSGSCHSLRRSRVFFLVVRRT
jgi:hypothetical protein